MEKLRLKMPQQRLNWLNRNDIINLLQLEGFEVIKSGRRLLFPKYFPFISWLFNKILAFLPFFNFFGITNYTIARSLEENKNGKNELASIIIPARNEKGNIEEAVKRILQLPERFEIIFIEGNSTDQTFEEIERVSKIYSEQINIIHAKQEGKGKGDAVRKGFEMANGSILMILDADLTVDPEELSKFYKGISENKGEFMNGSRLIYPLEKDSMRFLNMIGNKFFSVMFSWLLGQRLKDTLCGTKVLSKENWEKIKENRKYFGEFDPFGDFDLLFGAAKLNLKIVEIPIRYKARSYGKTNISRFRHGILLIRMMFFAMNKIKFI